MLSIQNLKQRIASAVNDLKAADARKREQQARAQLPSALSRAQAQVEGVKSYVFSLPVAVGPAPHQLISEAEAELRFAAADPLAALARARHATDLANESGRAAQTDVQAGVRGYGGGGFGRPAGGGSSFASGLGAGILGGVAGNMIFGGGEREEREYGEDSQLWASGGDGFGGDSGGFGGSGDGSF